MKIHTSCETFEFQQAAELPKPLTFATSEDALIWLKRLWSQDSDLISQLRNYLARYFWEDSESHRLTDYETLERLARLLHARNIVVFQKTQSIGGGTPSKKSEGIAPSFPLSERRPRAAANSTGKLSKTWISIELKDSNGKPVAGEYYKIELVDGRIVEGKLDCMGTAGVSGIDPGHCKVTFPRLDGSDWTLIGG